jgi:hypothetical protein
VVDSMASSRPELINFLVRGIRNSYGISWMTCSRIGCIDILVGVPIYN